MSQGKIAAQRDLMDLVGGPLGTLLAELQIAADGTGDEPGLPARANQLARLLVDEVVRVIRVGTQDDLAGAADALSEAIIGPEAERIAEQRGEAFRLVSAAAAVLASAVAPHSSGGELVVLRSWDGRAAQAVRTVRDAPAERMARAELRGTLGAEESYLSHLLSDLEAAGLIDRARDGRSVTVLLGPKARLPHVRAFLDGFVDPTGVELIIRDAIKSAIGSGDARPENVAREASNDLDHLRACVARFRQDVTALDISIKEVMLGAAEAVVSIRVVGRRLIADAPLAPVDNTVYWSVAFEQGQVKRLQPLAPHGDWLGAQTLGAVADTGMVVATDIRDIGYEVDLRGDMQLIWQAEAELRVGNSVRAANPEAEATDLLTEAIARVVNRPREVAAETLSLR